MGPMALGRKMMLIQVNTCHPLVARCDAKIADPSSGFVSLYIDIPVFPVRLACPRAMRGARALPREIRRRYSARVLGVLGSAQQQHRCRRNGRSRR